jgi:hypothetical protein
MTRWTTCSYKIINFIGHDLAIIIVQNLISIGSYGINMNVIHLLILFEHWCCVHCLDTNVICLFELFRHKCCVSIFIVLTRKSCTQLPCLNNPWHSCVNDMNPWNNKFCTNFDLTHEAYLTCIRGQETFHDANNTYAKWMQCWVWKLAQKYPWFQQAIVGGPFLMNTGDVLNITCNFNV